MNREIPDVLGSFFRNKKNLASYNCRKISFSLQNYPTRVKQTVIFISLSFLFSLNGSENVNVVVFRK